MSSGTSKPPHIPQLARMISNLGSRLAEMNEKMEAWVEERGEAGRSIGERGRPKAKRRRWLPSVATVASCMHCHPTGCFRFFCCAWHTREPLLENDIALQSLEEDILEDSIADFQDDFETLAPHVAGVVGGRALRRQTSPLGRLVSSPERDCLSASVHSHAARSTDVSVAPSCRSMSDLPSPSSTRRTGSAGRSLLGVTRMKRA